MRRRRLAQSEPFTKANRQGQTDSQLSLDEKTAAARFWRHDRPVNRLYVEREDISKNMDRYYAMSIEPTLFGDICLTRRWGRIGTHGQAMEHHFKCEEDAVGLFLDLLRQKHKRGCRPTGKAARSRVRLCWTGSLADDHKDDRICR